MKILHTVESYDPVSNGMQQVVKQLSERLANLGHKVTVATSYHPLRNSLIINGVKIEQFKISGKEVGGYSADEQEIQRYRDFVLTSGFDIVTNFAAQQWATDILLPILPQIKSIKVFVPTGFSGLFDHRFKQYFEAMKKHMANYDMNVFLSDDYQDINFARENGIKKIILIPNGAAHEEFVEDPTVNIRKQLNIPSDYFLMLSVGSHTGLKGHREAIKILKKVKATNLALLIVGNNPHTGSPAKTFFKFVYKTLVNTFSFFSEKKYFPACSLTCSISDDFFKFSYAGIFQKKILRIENLSRRDTLNAYMQADLFLFPSNIECSPLVLFESMASNTPFLATEAGNAKEIISWSNGGMLLPTRKLRNGYVIANIDDSARLLNQVINDKPLRDKMAASGLAVLNEKYSWAIIVRKYEELYSSLLSN